MSITPPSPEWLREKMAAEDGCLIAAGVPGQSAPPSPTPKAPPTPTPGSDAFTPTTPAEQAANALLCDMIGKREWDVRCAAAHIERYARTALASAAATAASGQGE